MLSKALQYRRLKVSEDRFMDIFFEDFIEHPMKTLRKIYQSMGHLDLTLVSRFQEQIETDHKRKYGQHLYSMEEFGLTKKMIDDHTGTYQKFVSHLQNIENK